MVRRNRNCGRRSDNSIVATHPGLGEYKWLCDGKPDLLFCDNETNVRRLFGQQDAAGFFKDAFHEYVIGGKNDAVNPQRTGTKAGAHYRLEIPAGGSREIRLRLARSAVAGPFAYFNAIFSSRKNEADEFYGELQQGILDDGCEAGAAAVVGGDDLVEAILLLRRA